MAQERKPQFATDSGIIIPPYLASSPECGGQPGPGEYPFTRGVYPTMYRSRLWTMRMYAGFGTAEESNQRYRYLLSQGVTGLSVAFDLPTQIGYDSDHALAEGEVGKVGVAIDSLADIETLFDGITLQNVSTSMTINSTASILLAFYVALAKRQGADLSKLSGTVQNDILKEYAARGTYIYPPAPSMRLITDMFAWCSRELPSWNTISISGYHIREAGSTAVQEVAFTLSNAVAYTQAAVDAGLDVDQFASRLSFFFNIHNNFFEEVAKLRAARRMWARIMKERFNAKDPRSMMLRFHSQTAGSTLTAQQVESNIVRVALQATAAVLGGTQSLHTNGFDEALGLPTENAARLALRTQQVVGYESGIADTVDPLAGSYFVEYLTDQVEEKATEYMERIERLGGAVRAIESGFIQDEIARSAYEAQLRVERGEDVVVGVNKFQMEEPPFTDILHVDDALRTKQIERLHRTKSSRNAAQVEQSLSAIRAAATDGGQNLMPNILAAVESYATLGEISDTLRKVWGEYEE
ncbi:MAG: methylmalonyl-CoA mutase [Chlorobi bacterium]|nr:MAG: methylmalonyl-CoA mutase [Chlorobi bacterium OLB7]MBK8911108.1 methylmalonyl-CoA mutase [Chlorobiota bacterium]MBX7216694.1 methylmalonyl-CoA mutase [Candidatus Kapabacteria bacterium]